MVILKGIRRPQSSSRQSQKRSTTPTRTGLIHVASMLPGVAVPAELQALKYSAVIVEVGPGEATGEHHAMLNKLMQSGIPILLAGTAGDLQFVMQTLRREAEDEPLNVFDIAMYQPSREGQYLFTAMKLSLVSKNPIGFRVCCVTRACSFALVLCF